MIDRDQILLGHIIDAINQVEIYSREGREMFLQDRKTQDAIVRNLEIVGEATKNLSEAVRTLHADVPWRDIAGMRDRLIHGYMRVNLDKVWATVEQDLPALPPRIEALMRDRDRGTGRHD